MQRMSLNSIENYMFNYLARQIIGISLVCCIALIAFTSDTFAQRHVSGLSLVPNKAVAVVQVNWAAVRRDESLKQIIHGEEFARIVEKLGINENRIREFTIFADATPTTANKLGMIISGGFQSQDVVRYATNKNWSSESVKSRKAFINPADGSYLLLLRDGLLVTGTRSGVERTAETFAAPATGLATKKAFKAIFSQMGTSAPIRFFLGVPQEYQFSAKIGYFVLKHLLGIGFFSPLGIVMNAVGLIQSVGMSISSGGDMLPVHLVVQMPGKIRATLAAKGLNYLKSAAVVTPTADSTALNSMSVNNTGAYLSIRLKMPKSDLVR